MIHTTQGFSNDRKRNMDELSLDKIIKDETLEKLVEILRSYGKNDAEIEESLQSDLGLSRQRLKRFLKLSSEQAPDRNRN